ncbi:hypothetical protein HW555_007663 [Spodoptera exigua]|uniref:Ig-like domain-containing protein n=1 Tax=Spodoptera exigua TaxID=7107 RepID=A0A835GGF2_SPOEX|nr:hypothetical protein HW555_007663 [Spodoptera exigua]
MKSHCNWRAGSQFGLADNLRSSLLNKNFSLQGHLEQEDKPNIPVSQKLKGLQNQGLKQGNDTGQTFDPGDKGEVIVLRAMRNREARLPCGRGKITLDGPQAYVVWLRHEKDIVYKYPNSEYEEGLMNPERIIETSCNPGSCRDHTNLLLKKVTDHDGGVYRCRVHYQSSPTVDHVIKVRVVDSPGIPKILVDGKEIRSITVGPLSVGSNVNISCQVELKDPATEVYWRRNGAIMETTQITKTDVLRADIYLENLTRNDAETHFECLAQTSDVSEALVRSIVIRMICNAPLSVHIRLDGNYNFEVGVPRVIECLVVGSYPAPFVGWFLGDSLLTPTSYKQIDDGNATVSTLTLSPALEDSRKYLTCRAHNMLIPLEQFEEKVTINVGFAPKCETKLIKRIGVVKQEPETVTCTVQAAPAPVQFKWTFRNLKTSVSGTRYSSNLTWHPRDSDFGRLECRATNSFGIQKIPCLYNITQGGPPETPECDIARSVASHLNVDCRLGWDGGRKQTVIFELVDESQNLIRRVNDSNGHYRFRNLPENENFTATYYSSNSRGKSKPVTLVLKSLASAIKESKMQRERNNHTASSHWMSYVEPIIESCHRNTDSVLEPESLELTNTPFCSPVVPTCSVLIGCPNSPTDETNNEDEDDEDDSQQSFFV